MDTAVFDIEREVDYGRSITWSSPGRGLWAASTAGEYLGIVERVDGTYIATGPRGEVVGEYDTLSEAQQAVDHMGLEPEHHVRSLMITKVAILIALLATSASAFGTMLVLS